MTAELALLLRVAKRLCGNADDAEDLVGVVLLKAAQAWSRFDGMHARSWLIQILRNEHQNVARKRYRRGDTLSLSDMEIPETKTEKRLADAMLTSELTRALDLLPEKFRLPIVLCDMEEMSYEMAASALGIGLGTVRTRLHRGRRMMRHILTERLGEAIHAIASPL